MSDWTLRKGEPSDEGGLLFIWLRSFAHSRFGKRSGAQDDKSQNARDYWERHRPIVLHLLRSARVDVICDPSAPEIIWAFCCSEGDVIHYLSAKRKFHQEKFSADMFRFLLGDRLKRACRTSHELVEFKRQEVQASGLFIPETWTEDPYCLLARQLSPAHEKAA